MEKPPVWRKILHLPIHGGREILWTCMGFYAIPVMQIVGIGELAMYAFAISGCFTIIFSVIVGFYSDRCSMSIGRRRPYLLMTVLIVILATGLEYLGTISDISSTRYLIFFGLSLQDFGLWLLQVPMISYTLEVFSGRDQQQMMTGVSFFTGAGGIFGYYLTSQMSAISPESENGIDLTLFYISTLIFAIVAVMNLVSMPEKTLAELEAEDDVMPKLNFRQLLSGYFKIPKPLLKLGICQFFIMYSLITQYVYFGHHYAEFVYRANPDFIAQELNETQLTSNLTNIDDIFQERYAEGLKEGAKIMSLFPISAAIFSFILEFFNLMNRIGYSILLKSSFIFYIAVCVIVTCFPEPAAFGAMAVSLGYFLAIQCTVPNLLVYLYRLRSDYPHERGLAIDCAVLGVFNSLGQVSNCLLLPLLLQWYGNSYIMNPYSAVSAFVGLLVAQFAVEYENKDESKEDTDNREDAVLEPSSNKK